MTFFFFFFWVYVSVCAGGRVLFKQINNSANIFVYCASPLLNRGAHLTFKAFCGPTKMSQKVFCEMIISF